MLHNAAIEVTQFQTKRDCPKVLQVFINWQAYYDPTVEYRRNESDVRRSHICIWFLSLYSVLFFLNKMFRGSLSLKQENHHFTVQIGKNKCSHWTKLPRTCITSYYTAHNNFQIGMRLCSLTKIFIFFSVIFTKCLGVRMPLRLPRKKSPDYIDL
jgi:hypothetical protein